MPVDLDELITGLGRQADAIPLGTAERARQRGQQRTRNRAVAFSAIVVSLVLVGVAGALGRTGRNDHPVSPIPSGHALPEVARPVPFGGTLRDARSVVAGGRAFTAWQDAAGTVRVIATDPRTGTAAWTTPGMGRSATLIDLQAVSPAVLVTVEEGGGRIVHVLRPSDGTELWQLPVGEGDSLLPHDLALVRWSGESGQTDAYVWATGVKRWSLGGGGDPPPRVSGMYATGDMTRGSFVGDSIVRIIGSGKAEVRDVGTGVLIRTVSAGTPSEKGGGIVLNGRLFTGEQSCCDTTAYQIRMTDLATSAGVSAVVYSQGAGHTFAGLDLCGIDRLCVLDQDRDRRTTLTAIDLATRRTLWRVSGPEGAFGVSAVGGSVLVGGGGTTVLYDTAGREVFRAPDGLVDWLTTDKLLVMPARAEGPVVTVGVDTGRTTRLGDVPVRVGPCGLTAERLVCATATGLHVWSLTG